MDEKEVGGAITVVLCGMVECDRLFLIWNSGERSHFLGEVRSAIAFFLSGIVESDRLFVV